MAFTSRFEITTSKKLYPAYLLLQRNNFASYSKHKIEEGDLSPSFLEEAQPTEFYAEKCNKSGLLKQHRNILKGEVPYEEPCSWIHTTEKYQRKIFGRYGLKSGVNPRICFGTHHDRLKHEDRQKFEQPHTFSQMMLQIENDRLEQQQKEQKRELDIETKLKKLDTWKSELSAKIAKKEADIIAAKERKDRLIEEVRRHFGFTVDPRDEKFKEMLEQKEKEDKKKMKEAKKKVKEEKMMAKLIEKTQ